jgi:hypothetical protein
VRRLAFGRLHLSLDTVPHIREGIVPPEAARVWVRGSLLARQGAAVEEVEEVVVVEELLQVVVEYRCSQQLFVYVSSKSYVNFLIKTHQYRLRLLILLLIRPQNHPPVHRLHR